MGISIPKQKEKAILISLVSNSEEKDSLDELSQLVSTAGAEVVEEIIQKRVGPDGAYYIGKGKAEEVHSLIQMLGADLVVIDDEITPVQQRNLEKNFNLRVLDRTELILDIFAQRARTREGMFQVELAQLKYLLPRLTGRGVMLSRLGGGIGTRGPGETKLEVDRRRIRKRIADLETKIEEVKKHRGLHRKRRKEIPLPLVALIGYTNTGKSTLLNVLSGADVLVESKLFATLDPTTRKVILPRGWAILLTDTVGFIRHLPHQLVAAFRATLEEVVEAEILLHIVDASHPQMEEQIASVYLVLEELNAINKPVITVFNKIDKVDNPQIIEHKAKDFPNSVLLSALYGYGLSTLLGEIEDLTSALLVSVKLAIPYGEEELLAQCYTKGRVIKKEFQDDKTIIYANITRDLANKLKDYTWEDDHKSYL